MGTRAVKTITLSTEDIELLRMAIYDYRERYSPETSPKDFEKTKLAQFCWRLTPVMQVTPSEFLLMIMNPIALWKPNWRRRLPNADADRDPDIQTIVTGLSSLGARLFQEFKAQDQVLVDDEVESTGEQIEEDFEDRPR